MSEKPYKGTMVEIIMRGIVKGLYDIRKCIFFILTKKILYFDPLSTFYVEKFLILAKIVRT